MTLMVVAAICPKCSEIRARSTFTFQRGEAVKTPLTGDDFQPVGRQPQPRDGEASVCVDCGTTLSLRPIPADTANGNLRQPEAGPAVTAGVDTLFEARAGEEVKEMRNLGPDKMLVITTRRILTIDLNRIVEDA